MAQAIIWPDEIPVPHPDHTRPLDPRSEITGMDSGRIRLRRQFSDPLELLEVTWNFTDDQFQAFESFFTSTLSNGEKAFTIYLEESEGYDVQFYGSYQYHRADNHHQVTAVLEVISSPVGDIPYVPPPDPPPPPGEEPEDDEKVYFKKTNGPIYSMQYGPNKTLYIFGRFTLYGNDEEGWAAAPGIIRIKRDGSIDTAFNPGTGFDVAEPYYAPTQAHNTADGGIVIGLSYSFLHERDIHPGDNEYGKMKYQGVETPPVIRINPDGSRNTSFITDFLLVDNALSSGTAHNYRFYGFMLWEANGYWYSCYHADVSVAHDRTVEPLEMDGAMVVDRRSMADSTLEVRTARHWGPAEHRLYVIHESFSVIVDGMLSEAAGHYKIVNGTATEITIHDPNPLARGIIVYDVGLNLKRPWNWVSRTGNWEDVGMSPTPYFSIHGMYWHSVISGNNPVDVINYFAGGPDREGKGVTNLNIAHDYGSFTQAYAEGGPARHSASYAIQNSEIHLEINTFGGPAVHLTVYGNYPWGLGVAVFSDLVTTQRLVLDANTFGLDALSVDIVIHEEPFTGDPDAEWAYNYLSPFGKTDPSAATSYWDLRAGGAMEDDGWSYNPGSIALESGIDGTVMIPLWPYKLDQEGEGPAWAGVWMTGPATHFKGAQVHTKPYQLHKLFKNGALDPFFSANVFGPDSYPDFMYAGVTIPRIFYAALSETQKVLYVAGRFKEVNGDGTYWHAVSLDPETGQIATES